MCTCMNGWIYIIVQRPISYVEHLQRENDQLRAQIEKNHDLGKYVRDKGRAVHPIARNRGKDLVIPGDVDTLVDDESSLNSSSSLSLSLAKNARESTQAKSHKKPSHHPAFSDAISCASRRVRREACKRQNQPDQAPWNASVLPTCTMPPMSFLHSAFGTGPTFYMLPPALIRRPDDMLSSPLGQHILDY